MRSVYRVLAEEGGRLFYPKEGDSDDLSTHFAPLQRLGLLEGPEDNSKWVVLHQASNVLPLLDRLAGAVEQSGPTKEAQFTEILSLMDKERLPALESEADCPKVVCVL